VNIRVRIERLILDGLPISAHDGPLVQASVEAELARLLAADGLAAGLAAGGAREALPAGALQLSEGVDAHGLGRQIAAAVYGRIGR
jgi:hypothetical protein